MISIRKDTDGSWPERRKPFGFRPVNLALLASGLVGVVLGYFLLARGSTTAAPLLLMLGYAVLVPAGLLWGLRDEEKASRTEGE